MQKQIINMEKTCILCNNRRKYYYRLCETCFNLYSEYIDSDWFREVEKLQDRQDKLDARERKTTKHNKIGRPKTDHKIVQKVLDVFDNSEIYLSLRAIQKRIDGKISHETVQEILLKYRRDAYICKKNKSILNRDR